ncbi:DEAD/DEAH box helicase family protein [Actinoplanes couchii]|uniref:Uncharacterized protein n=1 Tax=Actinoplanes couchii TaxID=403638 RepID=A0ABQ3XI97_9ACTN|nr:DEAD/DEAH box helicase family protein [Actinoplanes couchii]MDR6324663.1 restriction endonuclease [Actinoplanes couchii]GID58216.1 hypothetical protein Aco03nite_066200 [Actinoplanes couchii]
MRLRFKVQEFQTEAVTAVADCFAGQPRHTGPGNAPIELTGARLLANVRAVQERAGLSRSSTLTCDDVPNLDVEMETGTGKTYVYIRTIMELHRRYGWSRFIVVVPGVAIREGVRKTFQVTADHFHQLYGTRPRCFTYDSSALHELERFRTGSGVQVMIINLQAFNSAARRNRRIYEELDGFQSRRPIDVISAARPVVVVDEPQRIGSARSLESLSRFGPLMVLRYSATHRVRHDLVHRLDAAEAYREKLVKRIAVIGIDGADGPAKRRLQIREVIRAHLEKERELHGRGVKVLSLLFIDQVRRYRDYSRPDQLGEYARIFTAEYSALTSAEPDGAYRRYLDTIPVERTHQGYFAIDRRTGRQVDGHASDVDAYDLILRDRERLLSLDEPVRFVFSHSALREGWDNPNVFVMGLLKRGDVGISRRQEIGRGLRLAVDQHGERLDDPATVHEINELTVVTDESYASFVEGLQRESWTGEVIDGRQRTKIPLNANFRRYDFQEALSRIGRRVVYRVAFDSARLVQDCVATLDAELVVESARLAVQRGSQVTIFPDKSVKALDLIGELTDRTHLTRHTISRILTSIRAKTFAQYRKNPDHFLTMAADLITQRKSSLITDTVTYQALDEQKLAFGRLTVSSPGPRLHKHVYDYAGTAFAQELESRADVLVYARLPGDFTIPTPLGDHHPGWLIVCTDRVVVTAGADDPARIACARRWAEALDGVEFSVSVLPSAHRSAGDRKRPPHADRHPRAARP